MYETEDADRGRGGLGRDGLALHLGHPDVARPRPAAHRKWRGDRNYAADLETVVRLLNEALATEIVCVLRYKRHYYMASGIHAQAVADEFLEHAGEEQEHADQIAAAHHAARRRAELRSRRACAPAATRSTSRATTLLDMIREDLVAERIAIESYSRDRPLPRRQGPDDAPHDGGDPREGRGACRGPPDAERDAFPLSTP